MLRQRHEKARRGARAHRRATGARRARRRRAPRADVEAVIGHYRATRRHRTKRARESVRGPDESDGPSCTSRYGASLGQFPTSTPGEGCTSRKKGEIDMSEIVDRVAPPGSAARADHARRRVSNPAASGIAISRPIRRVRQAVRAAGGEQFAMPEMGSHGGATLRQIEGPGGYGLNTEGRSIALARAWEAREARGRHPVYEPTRRGRAQLLVNRSAAH